MGEGGDSSPPVARITERTGTEEPEQRIEVALVAHAGDWGGLDQWQTLVEVVAREVAADVELPAPNIEIALALSNDGEVRKLNHAFRGQDKATNVLSFPANPGDFDGQERDPEADAEDDPVFLGDIAMAFETLEREALELDIPLSHHFQHLTAHGILHILGFDHEDDRSADEMESLETRILERLGVPDPYAEGEQTTGDTAGSSPRTAQIFEQ